MPQINGQNLATVSHVTTLAQRVKSELDNLDGRKYGDVAIADGQIKFYAKAGDTTPLKTVDLPEELFLDQVRTTFVPTFVFSNASYPNATKDNLDGKPVLVLAVKGDKATNPTLTYSFINLETLIDTYAPMNAGISIAGYSIGVQLSNDAGNILSIANDGLKGSLKLAGAGAGNFAIFGADGSIVDSGFSVASNADINTMLTNVFGASGA